MKKLPVALNTPARVMIAVGAVILGAEFLLTPLINALEQSFKLPVIAWNFIDAATLTAVVSPALYFLIFRTMRNEQIRHKLFRDLLDQSTDGIYVVDSATGRFLDANEASCRILGYSREELLQRGVMDIQTDIRDAAAWQAHLQELRAKDVLVWEHRGLRKDGSQFPVEVGVREVVIENHNYLIGAVRDITERKQAELELRESEARFHALADVAGDLIYTVAADGKVSYVNETAAQVLHTVPEQVIGKHLSDLFPPEIFEQYWRNLQKVFKTGEPLYMEALHGEAWEGTWLVPLRDASDNIVAMLGSSRDITERKQAEEQIRKLNAELESKVQERTSQLLEAQEELLRREKLSVLGQVAGSVGHELRNPLGVMSNAVYYLKAVLSDADESIREYLDIIKNELDSSEQIVSTLLDSVRTKPPQPERVNVRELLEKTLGKCAIPSSVTVKLDIPATLSPLMVDPQQIQQVLRNLISNGVEAMANGGLLEISAVENIPDSTVTVCVEDSGVGMTQEQLARIFTPLVTTKVRGIGLGLVVVKNLTQANGGTLQVTSEVGKGTTFSVTLPANSSHIPTFTF